MNEDNLARRWTLHKARPGKRNPTVATTSNPYDSLRDSEGMPEPVQTPQPAIPATTTQKQPPTVKTAPTANKDITVVDYSFLDTMSESSATKTIMDYLL
eukprot:CAMPEP_0168294260 /NCGR_PEP_ID=MMETSP0142_2-20121227/8546_1 /TAXON_ID=44445 /ORGANISM="Pseudo-nitzschia australis, Strain 10249 10 AB" /LENGTH=98 /DNA_ID=CAMNT_0008242541 /DNA_START=29 /DNA_END=328 /DNA_ORIENTATION=+